MRKLKKALALILSLVMLVTAFQLSSVAESAKERTVSSLPIASISDTHYYPESLMGDKGQAWTDFCRLDSKMYN